MEYPFQCLEHTGGNPTTPEPSETYNCDTNNPCEPHTIIEGQYFYAHDNPHNFVQCSAHGDCFKMECPDNLVWKDNTCNHP